MSATHEVVEAGGHELLGIIVTTALAHALEGIKQGDLSAIDNPDPEHKLTPLERALLRQSLLGQAWTAKDSRDEAERERFREAVAEVLGVVGRTALALLTAL